MRRRGRPIYIHRRKPAQEVRSITAEMIVVPRFVLTDVFLYTLIGTGAASTSRPSSKHIRLVPLLLPARSSVSGVPAWLEVVRKSTLCRQGTPTTTRPRLRAPCGAIGLPHPD